MLCVNDTVSKGELQFLYISGSQELSTITHGLHVEHPAYSLSPLAPESRRDCDRRGICSQEISEHRWADDDSSDRLTYLWVIASFSLMIRLSAECCRKGIAFLLFPVTEN